MSSSVVVSALTLPLSRAPPSPASGREAKSSSRPLSRLREREGPGAKRREGEGALRDDLIPDQRVDLLIAQTRFGEHFARMGAEKWRVEAFVGPLAGHLDR